MTWLLKYSGLMTVYPLMSIWNVPLTETFVMFTFSMGLNDDLMAVELKTVIHCAGLALRCSIHKKRFWVHLHSNGFPHGSVYVLNSYQPPLTLQILQTLKWFCFWFKTAPFSLLSWPMFPQIGLLSLVKLFAQLWYLNALGCECQLHELWAFPKHERTSVRPHQGWIIRHRAIEIFALPPFHSCLGLHPEAKGWRHGGLLPALWTGRRMAVQHSTSSCGTPFNAPTNSLNNAF